MGSGVENREQIIAKCRELMRHGLSVYMVEDGGFWGELEGLDKCYSQGDALNELITDLHEAMLAALKVKAEDAEKYKEMNRTMNQRNQFVQDSREKNAQGYMSKKELKDSRARMRDALQFDPAANDPSRSGGLVGTAFEPVPTLAASYMDALAQVNLELEQLRQAHDLLRTSLSPFLRVPAPTPMRDEPMPLETSESDASLTIYGIVRQVRTATEDIADIIHRFRP